MFIGRKKELNILEDLYNSNKFEMMLLYGRRRVGKSYLLSNFCVRKQNSIFFTADRSSELNNVRNFGKELSKLFNNDLVTKAETWYDIFSYINSIEIKERLVIVIDEFPYLKKGSSEIESILQNAIDNILNKKNIFLIICGSEVSFMEDQIHDMKRPLYGRSTCIYHLEHFTYKEAKEFTPNYTNEECITLYSIIGGIPQYLSLINDKLSIKDNIIKNCLSTSGFLYNEVETVLRMELSEPSFYLEILHVINCGASKLNDIVSKINAENTKVLKYLKVLINLEIVIMEKPCGANDNTRGSLYKIKDNYFSFWFSFIYKNRTSLNGLINPEVFYNIQLNDELLNSYVGYRFETICYDYLKEQSYNAKLPFFATNIGRWWGNNKELKKEVEFDIIIHDKSNMIISECKFTNKKYNINDYNNLIQNSSVFNEYNKTYYLFIKSGINFDIPTNTKLITISDLYK